MGGEKMAKGVKEVNPNNFGALLFDSKEINAVKKTLENKMIFRYGLTNESAVDKFESKIKQLFNVSYCVGVSSGTSGLIAALSACDVKQGDRVLVSSYTFLATALAVIKFGAIPVPMEIDAIKGIDIEDLKNEVRKGCKAVIVVQLQGRTFYLDELSKFLKKNNIPLIEDACQSFYCKNEKAYSGTIGDIGVFSFQQFKQLSAGEGGCVITNNDVYATAIRNYTDMGSERDGFPSWNGKTCVFGENYRMTNISASILLEQLKKLKSIIAKQKKAREYIEKKLITKNIKIIKSYYPQGDSGMNLLLTLCNGSDFNKVVDYAKRRGVVIRRMWSGVYYDNELFKNHHLTSLDIKGVECEKTIKITNTLLTVPIPPILSIEDCNKIINVLYGLKEKGWIA